ncbi:hypothetical protein FQN54_006472 [Arachnomyces sp. PD_36]|nr:hypothetical protein FQN54_006472 [Arachnomyces sp. PD_36]
MCIWYRGWYFESCSCIIWDKSWSCGHPCPVPRRKLLRKFLGECPNCKTMSEIPREEDAEEITEADFTTVPCDSQYDPSDVFDEALEEHIRYHPWNIMLMSSFAASGEVGDSSVWGPSLKYDTPLSKYKEEKQQPKPMEEPDTTPSHSKSKSQQQEAQTQTTPQPTRQTPQKTPQSHGTGKFALERDLQRKAQAALGLIKPRPPVFEALDGGYVSDEDPLPPEYRYKR